MIQTILRLLFFGLTLLQVGWSTGLYAQTNAAQVIIYTSDIDHFWQAYDQAQSDSLHRVAIFRQHYFEPGTTGLRDFLADKILTVNRFVAGLDQKPLYYQSIRKTTLQVSALRPQIITHLRTLQDWYPRARFPPIYLLIGGYRSGGTVSSAGLLIGVDQLANGPGVNLTELTLVQRNRCGRIEDLPIVVVHELIHGLQQVSDGTLLHDALNEGMADFIAGLVSHTTGGNSRLFAYGDRHEAQLWASFQSQMYGKDHSDWIGNGKQETRERPSDLGYYVGYKICEAYFRRSVNAKQAIFEMLHLTNAVAFLERSGYVGQEKTGP